MTLQLVISVVKMDNIMIIIYYHLLLFIRMDAIKKKMEKLANETNEAEMRIAHFEDIKAANELEVAIIKINVIILKCSIKPEQNNLGINIFILG